MVSVLASSADDCGPWAQSQVKPKTAKLTFACSRKEIGSQSE